VAVERSTIDLSRRPSRKTPLRSDLRRLEQYRSLVRYMISSTLRTENTGGVFGFAWWILDPLLMMLVFWFVFGVIFKQTEPAFPIFILISLLSWEFFVSVAQSSMAVTIARERTMRQVPYPRSAIPLSLTLAKLAHLVVGLALAAILAWIFYGIVPSPALAAVPVLALLQAVFVLGASLFLAALNVFFRDVAHLSAYAFRVWYFLSPGIYAITRVPEQYRTVYQLNPFATFFGGYHAAILHQPAPGPVAFAYVTVASFTTLLLGYRFFVLRAPRFAKLA
jgi:ABC-type polysaccharide/polyol phosphate export permease